MLSSRVSDDSFKKMHSKMCTAYKFLCILEQMAIEEKAGRRAVYRITYSGLFIDCSTVSS